jgi:hypothetical protein
MPEKQSPMGRELILHVGAHKTGTKTIQQSLERLRDQLNKKSAVYVSCIEDNTGIFLTQFFDQNCTGSKDWDEYFKKLRCTKVIISDEVISLYSEYKLKCMRQYFEKLGFSIHVHYFLRDPLNWKQSDCKQIVRSGLGLLTDEYKDGIKQRYIQFPRKLDHIFGEDKVNYHIFEQAVESGLVNYFITTCAKLTGINVVEIRENESLSDLALKMANINNQACKYSDPRSRLLSEIINTAPGEKSNNIFEISPGEALSFNKTVKKLNRRIGKNAFSEITAKPPDLSKFENISQKELIHFFAHANHSLLLLDQKVTGLMETAKKLEDAGDINGAVDLVETAELIRPWGPIIRHRLKQLHAKAAARR